MSELKIVEAEEKYLPSHAETINGVAHEGLYLSNNKGFTFEELKGFYNYCVSSGFPQYFLVNENDEAVGWCDIVTRPGYPSHIGFIGVGMRAEYRDQGNGRRLMLHVMDEAKKRGYKEIRLDCRAANKRAIHLYTELGFKRCGYRMRGLVIDGRGYPVVMMRTKL